MSFEHATILALILSEEEKKLVLERYIDVPHPPSNVKEGVQIMGEVVKLTSPITKEQVQKFVAFSDKFPNSTFGIEEIVDDKARFTIGKTFIQRSPFIGLDVADAKLWETWPHAKIAIWVKFIWGSNSKTHLDLNTQLDKFKIDFNSPQLAIFNTLGEEALMLSIHFVSGLSKANY